MKSLNQLLTAIFMLIALGFVGFQMFVASNAMGAMGDFAKNRSDFERMSREREATEVSVDGPGERELVILKEAGRNSPRDEVTALVNPTHFSQERQVGIGIIVDPRDLLKDGEMLPDDKELQELWIKVRSRHYSNVACQILIERFAQTCRPVLEDASKIRDHEAFTVNLRLDYTPAAPLGTLPESPSVVFEDFEIDSDMGGARKTSPGLDADWLREVLAKVEEGCDQIRQVHGNCSPLRIEAHTGTSTLQTGPMGDIAIELKTRLRAELGYLTAPAAVAGAVQ